MPEPKLYQFSTHIGAACARKMVSSPDLAEKLGMDVTDPMRQCPRQGGVFLSRTQPIDFLCHIEINTCA